jgi:hypothetical protein
MASAWMQELLQSSDGSLPIVPDKPRTPEAT